MSDQAANDTRRKAAAPFILFTVFLDMLSIGIMIPILPRLIEGFVGSVSAAGWWSGLFGTLWGLTQFFVSPIQGGLSDHYGRRPVVLASNLGSGIDYFLMALAPNLWWLLIGRIVSGMTAASVSTAYAYMSDVTPPEGRAKVFGLMGAAFGLGFVIGPGIGGLLGHFDPRYPFFLAGALSLLNFAYGYFVLPESLPKDKRKAFSFHTANPWGAVKFLARSKEVFRLSLMSLTLNFAHHSLQTTFVLYAGYRFGWGPLNVGLCLMSVGVLMGFVQAVLTGKIVKSLGEKKTMMLGLACGVIGFMGYGLAPNWIVFAAFVPVQALWGIAMPSIQALMTSKVDPHEQGTLQGANMSLSSLAGVIAPMVFGVVFSSVTQPGQPMWIAGAAFCLSAAFLLLNLFIGAGVKPSLKRDAEHYPDVDAVPPAH
jgi:MFS transporter, DHA1 family, tetracycline resistance protein